MSNTLSKKFWSILAMLIVVGTFLFALTTSAAVWTQPPGSFPANIDAPIHIGTVPQAKGFTVTPGNLMPGMSTNFIGADTIWGVDTVTGIEMVASKRFCLGTSNWDIIFNLFGSNPDYSNCITSWPTGGTTGTELWTAVGSNAMHQTELNRSVGIGTNNPATTLHVSGNILASQLSSPTSDPLIKGSATGGYSMASAPNYTFYDGQNNGNNRVGMYNPAPAELGFTTDGFDNIRIRNGNVAINYVNAPTERLDVNGKIRIRGGNPGLNKVLASSDANGTGSWVDVNTLVTGGTPQTQLWAATGNNISNTNSGNVKVGASTQNYKFNVLGTSYLEGKLVAPKDVILSNDSGASNNTKIGDPNSAPSNDIKLFVYGKTQLGNSAKILGSLDVTGSIRNRPGSGIETILGATQYPNGGAYNVSIDDPFYVSNDTTLSGKVKIDGKVRIVGGNPGTNKVLTSINTSGDAEWRSSVSDIKMVEGHWFLQNDGSFPTISCPANYKAIAVACDSSGDNAPDACHISPWNGIDGDTGTVPYRETNWSTSGGLYSGAVGSPDNNGVEFVIQLTCMRYQ